MIDFENIPLIKMYIEKAYTEGSQGAKVEAYTGALPLQRLYCWTAELMNFQKRIG